MSVSSSICNTATHGDRQREELQHKGRQTNSQTDRHTDILTATLYR